MGTCKPSKQNIINPDKNIPKQTCLTLLISNPTKYNKITNNNSSSKNKNNHNNF